MSDNTGTTASGGTGEGSGGNTGGGTTPPWFSSFADEGVRGYVESKGFKSAEALAQSYKNLEGLHSVGPERLLKLPEKLDDDKALEAIFGKLGRPEKPEGYDVKVPEGAPEDFAGWARGQFHGLGLTKRQGDKLALAWNARMTDIMTKHDEGRKTSVNQQVEKLKQEWGAAYDQNKGLVEKLAKASGLSDEQATGMAEVLGVDGLYKMLHGMISKFGIKLEEPDFKGTGGEGNNFGVLTPSGAKAKMDSLMKDPEWSKRYLEGGTAELDEMRQLIQWANPE